MKNKFSYRWQLKDGYPAKTVDYHGSTVFSCFAGGGGSTMGYKLAGYNVLGCNEIDSKMNSIYNLNHTSKYSFLEAIQTFKKRKKLPDELYNLDILDGSPPCSSFSTAGAREKYWGKKKKFREGQIEQVLDTLFFDFIDLAEKLQPKIVIAENVPGIMMGNAMSYKVNYVRDIHKAFDKARYVSQHIKLNASKMGVPQQRERVFFIALRKDIIQFNQQYNLIEKRPKINLKFDFSKIVFSKIDDGLKVKRKLITDKSRLRYISKQNKLGHWQTEIKSLRGKIGSVGFGYTVMNNLVPYTLLARSVIDIAYLDKEHYITYNELCLIGTFPKDYNFNGKSVSYVVGMSVPPVMMAQIAYQIYIQWLKKLK